MLIIMLKLLEMTFLSHPGVGAYNSARAKALSFQKEASCLDKNTCDYKKGTLPSCAPLALSYVPMQPSAEPAYTPNQALTRGTLFPGLDLPFMDMVAQGELTGTPLGEVMALDFVCDELMLYLDTHENDTDAFETLQKTLALAKEARTRYVEKFGPLTHRDLMESKQFNWLCNPWPWDYTEKESTH